MWWRFSKNTCNTKHIMQQKNYEKNLVATKSISMIMKLVAKHDKTRN